MERPSAELLIVDDDADAADMLAEVLEVAGYRVRIARDGREGLAELDERFPDLIVLDVEMPHLGGLEMALEMFVRDAGREDIPILLCSAVLELDGVAARVGTPYFLAKPYTVDAIFALVARVLVERRAPAPPLLSRP